MSTTTCPILPRRRNSSDRLSFSLSGTENIETLMDNFGEKNQTDQFLQGFLTQISKLHPSHSLLGPSPVFSQSFPPNMTHASSCEFVISAVNMKTSILCVEYAATGQLKVKELIKILSEFDFLRMHLKLSEVDEASFPLSGSVWDGTLCNGSLLRCFHCRPDPWRRGVCRIHMCCSAGALRNGTLPLFSSGENILPS